MKRLVCFVVFALMVAAIPVGASTFLALSQGELVAQSDAIVEGEVLKVNSFWTRSGRMIVTEAMVRVTDTIAGNAPSVVAVRTFGGEVGGFLVEAHGFPKFQVGERVVLFLQDQPNGTAEVAGYRLGHYRIVRDKAGVKIAVPTLEEGVTLLRANGAPAARPKAVQLDELKQMVRADVERTNPRLAN